MLALHGHDTWLDLLWVAYCGSSITIFLCSDHISIEFSKDKTAHQSYSSLSPWVLSGECCSFWCNSPVWGVSITKLSQFFWQEKHRGYTMAIISAQVPGQHLVAHLGQSWPQTRLQSLQVLQKRGSQIFISIFKTLSARDHHWQILREKNIESAAI